MIPLCEPCLQGKELEYAADCLNSGWISSNGEYVERLEKALAEYVGTDFAVACHEVLVPTVTFIAPVNAVRYVNAFPVFIDCDSYCNIDAMAIRRFLRDECVTRSGVVTNKTTGRHVSAIVPVHVFGTPVDMDVIVDTAAEYRLAVVEDATEALGSLYKGKRCGGLAPTGCLSFNGNKIITAGGGGAILTNDEMVARRARYLTTQAKEDGNEYIHHSVGYNYRMNNVLAAIGLAQLETIDERVAAKRRNFARYENALGSDRLLQQPSWSESNRWFYGYLCSDAGARARLLSACAEAGIEVRPLWYLNHLQQPYREMQAYQIENAVALYERVVNLPCSVNLSSEQIEHVTWAGRRKILSVDEGFDKRTAEWTGSLLSGAEAMPGS
jgi:perosamine synthetase